MPADPADFPPGLTPRQQRIKRAFDLALAVPGLIVVSPILVVAVVAATVSTRQWGIFTQERIGQYGVPFTVFKLRSMVASAAVNTTVTTALDPRITPLGRRLRAAKLDELPNLLNVVRGQMSLVGPRPDVAGWVDGLTGEDRVILTLKPGMTGPASHAFRHEEELLAASADPETYNREVIWPEKVRLNREYALRWSLWCDLHWLRKTLGFHQ